MWMSLLVVLWDSMFVFKEARTIHIRTKGSALSHGQAQTSWQAQHFLTVMRRFRGVRNTFARSASLLGPATVPTGCTVFGGVQVDRGFFKHTPLCARAPEANHIKLDQTEPSSADMIEKPTLGITYLTKMRRQLEIQRQMKEDRKPVRLPATEVL